MIQRHSTCDITTMHGCYPIDQVDHCISNIDGQFLYQLDGQPVMDVIDALDGHQQWRQQSMLKELSLGVHCGNKTEPVQEKHYKLPDQRHLTG